MDSTANLLNELRLLDAQEKDLIKRRAKILDQLSAGAVSTEPKEKVLSPEVIAHKQNIRNRALKKRIYV